MTKPSKKEKKAKKPLTGKKCSEKNRSKKTSCQATTKDYEQLDLMQAIKSIKENLSSIRHVIYIIHKNELWKEKYESFAVFEEQVLRNICGRSTTFRNLAAAKIDVILSLPIGTVPITIAEHFSGESLSEGRTNKIWKQAQEISDKKIPPTTTVKQCIDNHIKFKTTYKCLTDTKHCELLLSELNPSNKSTLKRSLKQLLKKLKEKD